MREIQVAWPAKGYSSHKSSSTRSYRCVQCFRCPNIGIRLPVLGICNVRTDLVDAWHCTRELSSGYKQLRIRMGSDNLSQESLYSGRRDESGRKKKILAAEGNRTRVSLAPGFSVQRTSGWAIPDPHYSPGDLIDLSRPAVLVTSHDLSRPAVLVTSHDLSRHAVLVTSLTSHVLLSWWPHTSCCPGDLTDLSRPAVLVTSLTSHVLLSWWPHWPLISCSSGEPSLSCSTD